MSEQLVFHFFQFNTEVKIWEMILGEFITFAAALIGAFYAFDINRKNESAKELIGEFFSHETLERRLNLHHVIWKGKFHDNPSIKYSDLIKMLEAHSIKTENVRSELPGYLDPDFVHVSQFFEKLIVFFEQKIVDRKIAWASLGRHVSWWYYEFYQRIEYDFKPDPRYSNAIAICQRLGKIVSEHELGASNTRYLRLQNRRYEPSLESLNATP